MKRGEMVAHLACSCQDSDESGGLPCDLTCQAERRVTVCALQLDGFVPRVGMTLLTPLVPSDGQGAWEVLSVLAWVNGRTGPKLQITVKALNAAASRAIETAKREADEDAAELAAESAGD